MYRADFALALFAESIASPPFACSINIYGQDDERKPPGYCPQAAVQHLALSQNARTVELISRRFDFGELADAATGETRSSDSRFLGFRAWKVKEDGSSGRLSL